jgi:hypothetical protein
MVKPSVPSFFLISESQSEDESAGKLTDRCVVRETASDDGVSRRHHHPDEAPIANPNDYSPDVSANSHSPRTDYSTEKHQCISEGDQNSHRRYVWLSE